MTTAEGSKGREPLKRLFIIHKCSHIQPLVFGHTALRSTRERPLNKQMGLCKFAAQLKGKPLRNRAQS